MAKGQSPTNKLTPRLDGLKRCTKCRILMVGSLDIFAKDGRAYDGLQSCCRRCATWYRNKPQWGLTKEQYQAKMLAQGMVCAACGERPRGRKALNLDHDHRCCSGKNTCGRCIRDFLCNWCNIAEGYLASPKIQKVIEYRAKWNA